MHVHKLGTDSTMSTLPHWDHPGIPVIIVRLGVGGNQPPSVPACPFPPSSSFANMGEYYELINIDKREWQGSWGKLMEFLFCAYPGKAAHWLLHPIVLPPMPHLPPHEHSQEVGNGSKAGG
jgi:hypothetical protein